MAHPKILPSIFVAIFAFALTSPGARAQPNPIVPLCAEFNLFPDDTVMPREFVLSAFRFEKANPADRLFVNETGGEKGLQFSPGGVNVQLPVPVPEVLIRVGVFALPVTVEGIDGAGATVARRDFSKHNTYEDVTLTGTNLRSLRFMGGGFEGLIGRICVNLHYTLN